MENKNLDAEIHKACKKGDWEIFQSLVNNSANIASTGFNGKTCLHFASRGEIYKLSNTYWITDSIST